MDKWGQSRKTVTVFLLLVVLLAGLLSVMPVSIEAAEKGLALEDLMEKFPHGKYWNGGNADSWTETPCNHHGNCPNWGGCGCNDFLGLSIQCMGFAEKLGYDATTYNPRLNANGWYKYFNQSSLNSLKPGDIVRISSASGYGHSIYVTGVNGENVTYADCNSRDSSCNIRWGATTTKSELKSKFEWLQSAPAALRAGYLSKCVKLDSVGTVTVVNTTLLRALPCSDQTDAKSVVICTQPKNTKVTVTALYRNSGGNYWYKTSYNGKTCYLYAGDTDGFVNNNKITISGVSAPANTRYGSGFPIKGKVESGALNLTKVGAYIYAGTNVNASPYMTSEASAMAAKAYEIYSSPVDDNLRFGRIAVGDYTYVIKAATISYSADKNVLKTQEQTKKLHQNTFRVSATLSCSHQYTQEVTRVAKCGQEGSVKFTCTKCKYVYIQTTFSDSVHNYQAQVTPPSCTKQGYTTYTCAGCGHSYVGNQTAMVAHQDKAVSTVAPTCTKQGYTNYACSVCGRTYVGNYTAVVAHQDKAVSTVAPTCTKQGYTNYACSVCGRSYQADVREPLGHDEAVQKGYPATCTLEGRTDQTYCSRCDMVMTEAAAIPAVGHSYQTVATPPRDGKPGYNTYTCHCGDSYTGDYAEPRPEAIGGMVGRICEKTHNMLVRTMDASAAEGFLLAEQGSAEPGADTRFTLSVTEQDAQQKTLTIQDFDGRYVYMTEDGTVRVSDTLPEKGFLWTMTDAGDSAGLSVANFYTGYILGYDAEKERFGAYAQEEKSAVFEIIIEASAVGDLNADNTVDNMDVEYLLWHTLFPEDNPLPGNADYNRNGMVDNLDVEYLLWHTLFPEDYPFV